MGRRGRVALAVVVTTIAGASAPTPDGAFTYTACVVPNLLRKKLAAARRAVAKGGCQLGGVRRRRGAGKNARVISQTAKPRVILSPGAKVGIRLG